MYKQLFKLWLMVAFGVWPFSVLAQTGQQIFVPPDLVFNQLTKKISSGTVNVLTNTWDATSESKTRQVVTKASPQRATGQMNFTSTPLGLPDPPAVKPSGKLMVNGKLPVTWAGLKMAR